MVPSFLALLALGVPAALLAAAPAAAQSGATNYCVCSVANIEGDLGGPNPVPDSIDSRLDAVCGLACSEAENCNTFYYPEQGDTTCAFLNFNTNSLFLDENEVQYEVGFVGTCASQAFDQTGGNCRDLSIAVVAPSTVARRRAIKRGKRSSLAFGLCDNC